MNSGDVRPAIPKQSGMRPCVCGLRRGWTWLILLLGARLVHSITLAGGPWLGLGMEFNGVDQQVVIPHAPALNSFPFTASFWLRTTQTDFHAGVLGKYISGSGNGWTVFLSDGRIRAFHFRDWGSRLWEGDMPTDRLSGGFVADGLWHHIAFTADQRGGRLYVDGELKDTVAWTGFPGAATSEVPLSIGSATALPDGTGGAFLRGRIDEVRLWSRALTPEEVRASMLQSLDGNPAGLVAAYDFNQMSGPTLTNRAVTGGVFDGVLRGSVPPRFVAFDDPSEAPGSIVVNGDFEALALAPWRFTGDPAFQTNPPAPWLSLPFSAQGVRSFAVPGSDAAQLRLSQTLVTEPGREYRLTFAHAMRSTGNGAFGVEVGGVALAPIVVDDPMLAPLNAIQPGSGTWGYANRRFIAVAASTELAFVVPPTLAGRLHLDDVRVVPVTDAEPEIRIGLVTQVVTMEEGTTGFVVVRRLGRLEHKAYATLELRAGTAEVTGEAADVRFGGNVSGQRRGLVFQSGQSEVTVVMEALGDTRPESVEIATVHLLATGNATILGGPATLTVMTAPTLITVTHPESVSEANTTARITLVVQRGSGGRVRVQTTAEGTATPGEDFVAVDQEVEVTSARQVSIDIPLRADSLIEGHETIHVRVDAVSENTVVTPTEFVITLVDDPQVTVRPEQEFGYRSEADPVAQFTLVRTGALGSPQTFRVGYKVEGQVVSTRWDGRGAEAARPGVDFVPTEGFVEFGPGIARHTIKVPLLDDSDGDGSRGLVLTLMDPPGMTGIVQGEALVIIGDDERAALRQQVTFLPYAPIPGGGGERPRLLARPDGKTLVIRGRRALQLTASGMPDLTFGEGTGQVVVPSGKAWGEWLLTPRQLPDGRLVFVPDYNQEYLSRIHRWTASGAPDPTFGGGSGVVELPYSILQVVQLSDDGGLLLVTVSPEGPLHLRRLLPNGEADPGFVTPQIADQWGDYGSISVAPDGHLWRVSGARGLWRLRPDGQVDSNFVERLGVLRFFGFDSQGRAYCQLELGSEIYFGDESQGGLVRFLADGTYDAAYRPLAAGTWVGHAEIEADGTALVVLGYNVILELNPAGNTHHVYPTDKLSLTVLKARRQAGGRLLLTIPRCWHPGCGEYEMYLEVDGTLTRGPTDWGHSALMQDATGQWSWKWRDWEAPDGFEPSSEDRLYRTLTPALSPQVGLAQSGIFSTGSSVRLPLQRAGNTSGEATVRGRILSWFKGRWDETTATPFEVSIRSGVVDWQVDLPLPEPPVESSVHSFLVRLEGATGVELSPLNECRIWAMNDAVWPQPGELKMTGLPGPGTDDTALLLLRYPIGKPSWFESQPGLGSGPWSPYSIASPITLGPVLLMTLPTVEASQGFFRLRH